MTVNLASTTTRKNLCSNPSFGIDASGWTYTLGGASIARSTARASVGGFASGLVTWATAAAGAQAEGIVVSGLTNGQPYTVSANVFVPATMPRVKIDALGLTASTPSSVNGAWQRLSFTFTANAATATIRLVCNDAGTAGQTANIDRVLVESGSVVGTYFDGETANAWWDGTAGTSTSEQVVPAGLNPNQPLMGWRVFTGENPPAVPNAPTTVPLVLSDRARSFKIERGRQYELDQDQTGTASVTLQNDDGALIGGQNNMYPGRLGEFRVTYQGVNYVLYQGYVTSWPDKASDPATSEAELSFVDLMDVLANQPLDPMYMSQLKALSPPPTFLWPFAEAAGSKGVNDVAGVNNRVMYPVVDYKGGDPGSLSFGAPGLCYNDSTTCMTNDNTTGATGKASQVQFSGPALPNGVGPSVDTTRPWMVLMVLKATGGKSSVFSILDKTGAVFASLSFDTSTWSVIANIGGATYTWAAGQSYLGGGVVIGIGYDGASPFVYQENARVATTGGAYAARGVCSWVAAGASFSGTQIYNGGNSTYWMQYLSLWCGGTIPDTSSSAVVPLYDLYYAFTNAYSNVYRNGQTSYDNTVSRMKRILGWAHQGGLAGDNYGSDAAPYYNTGWLQEQQDTKGAAPIDLLRQVALGVWGRFFISKGGLPTFHSKDNGQTQTTPKYVFGSNTAGGEYPYTGSPGFDYDVVHVYNDVQISMTGEILPDLYATYFQKNVVFRWLNSTSIGKYFTRVLQSSSVLFIGPEALYLAQYLSNRYAEPDYRIGEVVLDPVGYPALWPVVLGLELNDVVQVNHRDLHNTRSAWYQVAKIRHEAEDGSKWNTTLSLTPFHQYWLMGAMHTTLAASCLAGATTISLNPLPDSATNAAEASLGVGTTIALEPGSGNAETVTINSVVSAPTPNSTGYTSITLGVTATAHAHAAGAVACDPLPTGVTDPTTWDARSTLDSTTIITA